MPPLDLLPVFNAQPGATLLLSPDWVIVGASDDYLAATLTERASLVGQHIFEAFPDNPATPEANAVANVRASLETVLATKQPHEMAPQHYDVPDRTRPGRFIERYWQPRHTPVLDAAGQVQFIIQSVQDITASRQAERQLRESVAAEQVARAEVEAERQRLYQVLMRMPANIALLRGPEHVYDLVNAAYEHLFPARTILGRPLRQAIPDLEGQGFYELFDRVYETGEPFYAAEAEAWADFTGTGEVQRRYYRTSFEPIRNAQGQVTEVLNFAVDVTAQVEARQQVEQLNQQLEAARAAAERERTQLQSLLTQAPVAIALLQGDDLRVVSANALMAEIWGYTPADVLGRPLLAGVPELQGQGFDELLRDVMRTQVPFIGKETAAVMLRHGQLQTSYFDFVYHPHYEADGQVQGVIIVATDMTEQVRSRQQVEQLNQELEVRVQERTRQLSEQQALLNRILGQVPASVATLQGPDHRYSFVNQHYQQLVGNRVTLGRSVAEALPEAAEQGFVALLDQVYQTGEPYAGDETRLLLQQPTGPPTEHYINFVYQPLRDEQGQVNGILAFAVEVTEQVLARRERETQRRELATLFEQAPAGVCILDGPELVYSFANPAYQRILPGRELLGRSLLDAIPELRGTEVETLLRQVYATGTTYQAQEQYIPVARADGSGELENRYFTLVYQARRDEYHRITGILNLVVEVTEQVLARQQAEQSRQQVLVLNEELATINRELLTSNDELHASNTQLMRTNVDLDNFIYTASHDLKAPITNIEGLLLALEHELPAANRPGDVALMLTMMQEAVERFQRTIVHLTDLSRLQKEHNPASAAVALAPVVEAVRLDITPQLAQTRGQLTVSIPEGLTITFAEKNLRSVVYNLLSNAFKYHHPDRAPVVELRSWLADDYVVLEVQDNGLGLDLALGQQRLFGLFQRLHTHVEGTGIGLHMVKRMLENAGGRIEVSSQLGQGTTFHVYFRR